MITIKNYISMIYDDFREYIDQNVNLCMLKTLNYQAGQKPDYSDIHIQQLYLLRYVFSYAFEYKSMFDTLFAREKFKDSIEVASIGCGNMIDYWGLVEALGEIGSGECYIKYRGIDTIDWNYKIEAREKDEVKFTKVNAATIFQKTSTLISNVYIFPKSISEFSNEEFQDICESFRKKEIQRDRIHMPDYTAMGDVLKNVASEGRFPGKDVVTWLRLVMDTTDKIKVQAELDIVIPHIDVNAEYTKANVMGLFKGITTKKEVVRYVFENTGIMLYAYLRGEEERREYLSGNIDINYFDYDDTHAKYSVGEIGNGMKYTIERASVVREIQAVEGSKLIFKKVLPLMGVEFVRYGMLTVVPFPFKYLREYIVKEEKSV